MTRFAQFAGALAIAVSSLCASLPVIAADALIDGQVTKVDTDAGKITIKHGPIKKLDMDMDMTMAFKAADPAMLSQVKPGDKIKFDAEKVNGQFTVVKIEAKK
jgi:Cu/Ag efflux protein CusF